MPTKIKQRKYLKERKSSAISALNRFCETIDLEGIHELRVELKKVFALADFLKFAGKGKHKKLLKPVKRIFREAGIIRNAHINLTISAKYRFEADEFDILQSEVLTLGYRRFCVEGKAYTETLKTVINRLSDNLSEVHDKNVIRTYNSQLKQIGRKLNSGKKIDALHECRKRIKQLLYIYKILGKQLRDKLMLDVDSLDTLQGLIGKWHDATLAHEFLLYQVNPSSTLIKSVIREERKYFEESVKLAKKVFAK